MNDIIRFFRLSSKEKLLVIQVFYLLPYFKLKLRFVPFKKIIKKQHQVAFDDFILSDENKLIAFQVAVAINKVSNVLLWPSACFEKALAGKYLLKKYNIPSTLYLGAAIDEKKNFKAHAWLSYDIHILIGKHHKDQYEVVAKFD